MSDETSRDGVPDEVRRYLVAQVPSVPYLEAALLLRAEPDTHWDAARLSKRLYIKQRDAVELLRALRSTGVAIAAGENEFRYTENKELKEFLGAVAQAYSTNLLEVTALLHAKGDRRARVFADAFKLRKD